MDLVTQTSLDALLLKATNSSNQNLDSQAVDAFCALINKEKDGGHLGAKVIAGRLPNGNEREMLQTLNVLDICMSKCGVHFQNEVGKFRFLNEMIKLVSPKYLGSQTPLSVRQKILHLLYIWTLDYPKETKIKEAFDMLRKQGVIKQIPNPNVPSYEPKRKTVTSVFQDEEKSKILQKLLQSKDPEDIQAANWLIKSMVKEDDKRAELKSKSITELESIQNNVRLLNEMLDSYKPGVSSPDELELINELHQNCQRLKTPATDKLVLESIDYESEDISEGMLSDVVETSKELVAAINKYKKIILQDKSPVVNGTSSDQDTLLQFDVVDAKPFKITAEEKEELQVKTTESSNSTLDVLCDIFTTTNVIDNSDVLQPVSVLKNEKLQEMEKCQKIKSKALEDLDVLGELLMKENLQKSTQGSFTRSAQDKIPMNALSKPLETKRVRPMTLDTDSTLNLDVSYLLKESPARDVAHDSSDDFLVDISEEKLSTTETPPLNSNHESGDKSSQSFDVKLSDIFVKLEDIKPSGIPSMNILEKNCICVTLHLAKDRPKENVFVYVLTTVNKNELPLSDYLFQAVVPKGCKLRLQPPSSMTLPAHNPFLPPSAITQVLLIANPTNTKVCLKFIISYVMDDESITEMGEVDELPSL